MKVYNDVTELIGSTPVFRLNNIKGKEGVTVLLKLEMFNPGGSVKDRIAYNMIKQAEDEGRLKPGGAIIEPTSGNTGVGLAMIGAAWGYQVILTMPETMSEERRRLLKAYGAELVLTPGDKGMGGAIARAEELLAEKENAFMPQQFNNPANPKIHQETTAREIMEAVDGQLDYFVAGVGTGGTLSGTARVLKEQLPDLRVVAVEPETSAVISGEKAGPHKIQGIGAGFIPENLNTEIIDRVIKIGNQQAAEKSRELARREGLLLGISSGAALAAALIVAQQAKKGQTILAIAPDTGERYLSTGLFD